jgi:predicted AlkP superfamily phosphohydrolase/phosphomutase
MEMEVREGKEDSVLTHIHEILEARWETVRTLYQREDWDLFWVVFTQTDRIQHMFWGYMEPYDPRFDPEKAYPYRNAVHDLWVRQDQIIGELLAMTDPETTVLLLSDHGFGPIYRELRVMPYLRSQTVSSLVRDFATEIYAIDPFNASQLYVAVEGRDARAVINRDRQEQVIAELKDLLDNTLDPETGEPVAKKSWLQEEVFPGLYTDKGPDLTVLTNRGYFFVRAEGLVGEDVDPVGPLSVSLSGWHEMPGIYALRGDGLVSGRRDRQGDRLYNLMDITPTLLYLLGEPVPEGLDGIVMTGLLDPQILESRPVEYGAPFDEVYREDEIPDSTEIDRLKSLPYIGG